MYKLEFTYRFETAHRFTKGSSKCATPHGHSWYATLGFSTNSDVLNDKDMVEDFYKLKQDWKTFITETADHSFMHHHEDPILPALQEFVADFRGLPFPCDPTTEIIAALFLAKGRKLCSNQNFQPTSIVIKETPTNQVSLEWEGLDSVLARVESEKFDSWWNHSDPHARVLNRKP